MSDTPVPPTPPNAQENENNPARSRTGDAPAASPARKLAFDGPRPNLRGPDRAVAQEAFHVVETPSRRSPHTSLRFENAPLVPPSVVPTHLRCKATGTLAIDPCLGPDGHLYGRIALKDAFPDWTPIPDVRKRYEISRWRDGNGASSPRASSEVERLDPLLQPVACPVVATDGQEYDLVSVLNLWLAARSMDGTLPATLPSPLRSGELKPFVIRRACERAAWETKARLPIEDLIQEYDRLVSEPEPFEATWPQKRRRGDPDAVSPRAPLRSLETQQRKTREVEDPALAALVHDALTRDAQLVQHPEPGALINIIAQSSKQRSLVGFNLVAQRLMTAVGQAHDVVDSAQAFITATARRAPGPKSAKEAQNRESLRDKLQETAQDLENVRGRWNKSVQSLERHGSLSDTESTISARYIQSMETLARSSEKILDRLHDVLQALENRDTLISAREPR